MAGMRADATLGCPKTPFIPKCSVSGNRGGKVLINQVRINFPRQEERAQAEEARVAPGNVFGKDDAYPGLQ